MTVTVTHHICSCLCKFYVSECTGVVTQTADTRSRRVQLKRQRKTEAMTYFNGWLMLYLWAEACNILLRNANTKKENIPTCSTIGEGVSHSKARHHCFCCLTPSVFVLLLTKMLILHWSC